MKWMTSLLFTGGLFFWASGLACTEITLKAKNGGVLVARTLEFGPNLKTHIMTFPRDKKITNNAPNGKPAATWKAKYGYIFMDFFGVHHPVDGMNEKGLSFGYLYLPGYTQYQSIPEGEEFKAISYLAFGDWVLGNFDTVSEIKEKIKNIYVYSEPLSVSDYKNKIFPLHAIITDASGSSITIEFIRGKIKVYDNPTGVLTNSPTFPWQLTNIKNFIYLTPYSINPIKIDGISYSCTGQGSGSAGLPGDYSPPSRFIKMIFLTQSVYPVSNERDSLNVAQHIINNVDIPKGAVRGSKGENSPIDKTQWTVFKDLKNRILYFKSYKDTTLKKITLSKIGFSAGDNQHFMPISSEQIIIDVTKKYHETLFPRKNN